MPARPRSCSTARRPTAISSSGFARTPLLLPLIVLATVATIIASQSIITGAFSMTRQAIQLGWLPRLQIKQTSAEGYGQIYVGVVNWLLMVVTLGLTHRLRQVRQSRLRLWHRGVPDHADDLGAAVHRHARDLALEPAGRRRRCAGFFLIVDSAFFLANLTKVAEGGYVPRKCITKLGRTEQFAISYCVFEPSKAHDVTLTPGESRSSQRNG